MVTETSGPPLPPHQPSAGLATEQSGFTTEQSSRFGPVPSRSRPADDRGLGQSSAGQNPLRRRTTRTASAESSLFRASPTVTRPPVCFVQDISTHFLTRCARTPNRSLGSFSILDLIWKVPYSLLDPPSWPAPLSLTVQKLSNLMGPLLPPPFGTRFRNPPSSGLDHCSRATIQTKRPQALYVDRHRRRGLVPPPTHPPPQKISSRAGRRRPQAPGLIGNPSVGIHNAKAQFFGHRQILPIPNPQVQRPPP